MRSNSPGATSQQPRVWETVSMMWKNCPTQSASLSPQTEWSFVKAARTKREPEDRSPGRPSAPMPRL